MQDANAIKRIVRKYGSLAPLMDERMGRQWGASDAQAYGWGGVSVVSGGIGMWPNTIRQGLAELLERKARREAPVDRRVRRPGGGRKWLTLVDPELLASLEFLVDPKTRGDPESPLRWTCKSTTQLADALTQQAHALSPCTVGRLLNDAGYSLQRNRETPCTRTGTPSSCTSAGP